MGNWQTAPRDRTASGPKARTPAHLVSWAFIAFIASTVFSCKGSVDDGKTLCEPGTYVFCRCPGGQAGSRQCQGDGLSFGSCMDAGSECPAVSNDLIADDEYDSDFASDDYFGETTTKKLTYEPCAAPDECASGYCPFGYCSKVCDASTECGAGACVISQHLGPDAWCMPGCWLQSDCDVYSSAEYKSTCSFTWTVEADWNGQWETVCSDWGTHTEGIGYGLYDCATNEDCNLGNNVDSYCSSAGACEYGCSDTSQCKSDFQCSIPESETYGECVPPETLESTEPDEPPDTTPWP